MKNEEYLSRMLNFVFESGKLALKSLENMKPVLKEDSSVVTQADHAIAKLAHKTLKDLLQTSHHILIEEEDPQVTKYLDPSLLKKIPYMWVVDPIDGSRNYSNHMPNFAISIGVIRDLKPWLGTVYFPVWNELFYCDGEEAFFVEDAFMQDERKHLIKPIDQKITSQSVFLCIDRFFKNFRWDYTDCRVMIQACAALDLCWPTIGRGCGSIIRCSLWDFAGAWPIVQKAALHLRSLESEKVLKEVNVNDFERELTSWKLREFHILSSERNFSIIKQKIKE